jgi:hypothetical protein
MLETNFDKFFNIIKSVLKQWRTGHGAEERLAAGG